MNCKICNDLKFIEKEGYMIRCECLREENFEYFYKWSEADTKHKKELKELQDKKVFFEYEKEGETKRAVISLKEEMNMLIEDRMENIEDNFKILLKGTNGRGKTQFAISLSLEILKRMDLTENEIKINRFFFFNPMNLINENKLYNEERKNEIIEKVKKSDVLILDELGEELEMNQIVNGELKEDKRVKELHNFIKYLLDEFKGLLILTTNSEKTDEEYKKHNPRMYSRLFTKGSMNNYVFVGKGEDERSKKKARNKDKYNNRF